MSDDLCWTSLIGAPTHSLGDLPETCFTCAAKQREGAIERRTWVERGLACPNPTERAAMTTVMRDTASKVGQD